jgi:predicted Zn-dependent peptidase
MGEPRVTTLENGLRVVSEDSPHLATSAVGVWVDAGARNESESLNGISHLIEHMAFKGTARRTARDIAEEIEAVGGHLNAYTSREQTAFFARVLEDEVPLAIDIIADLIQNSTFDATELDREKAVVLQEIGQANDTPDDIVFDHFQEAAYPAQPIGRSILGTPERVSGFGRDDLFAYMGDQYHAHRMVVSAAGRVDHDSLVKLAEDNFGALRRDGPHTVEAAAYAGGDFRQVRDLEQVHLVVGFDSIAYEDPDYYVAQVYSTLLGGGMSSRLFQEVRENRGLCYSIYTFTSSYTDGGLFGLYAGTGEEEVCELVPAVIDEIEKTFDGLSSEEVARARTQLKAGLMMSLESSSARCEQFARQTLLFGKPLSTEEVLAKIDAVDAGALQRFAARTFERARPTVAAMGPAGRLEDYEVFAARFAA